MITRIEKSEPFKNTQKAIFLVFDEDTSAEFGFFVITRDNKVEFRITEEKSLTADEVEIIGEFIKKLHAVAIDDQLDTIQQVTYFKK